MVKANTSRAIVAAHQVFERGPLEPRQDGVGGSTEDGIDLLPFLLGGEAPAPRPLIWHFPHYWWGTRVTPYSVLREGDWKLIHQYASGEAELYDLAADPGEAEDLAAEKPTRVRRMRARLFQHLDRLGAKLPASNPEAESPGPAPPTIDR